MSDFMYKDVWRGDAKEWNRLKLDEIANYQQNVANNFNVFLLYRPFRIRLKQKASLLSCLRSYPRIPCL